MGSTGRLFLVSKMELLNMSFLFSRLAYFVAVNIRWWMELGHSLDIFLMVNSCNKKNIIAATYEVINTLVRDFLNLTVLIPSTNL